MEPARDTLILRRNAPDEEICQIADDGVAVDITGYSLRMHLRNYGNAPGEPLLTLVTVSTDIEGFRIDDPGQGIFTRRISIGSIDDLPQPAEAGGTTTLAYDLLLIAPDGFVEVLEEGDALVLPGVTRL